MLIPTCFYDMPNGGTAKRNRAKSGKASDLRGGGGSKISLDDKLDKYTPPKDAVHDKWMNDSIAETVKLFGGDTEAALRGLKGGNLGDRVEINGRTVKKGSPEAEPYKTVSFFKDQFDKHVGNVNRLNDQIRELEARGEKPSRRTLAALDSEISQAGRIKYHLKTNGIDVKASDAPPYRKPGQQYSSWGA